MYYGEEAWKLMWGFLPVTCWGCSDPTVFLYNFLGFTLSLLMLTNSFMVKAQSNIVLEHYYTRMFFITLSMPFEFLFSKTFSLKFVTCPNRRRGCILEWLCLWLTSSTCNHLDIFENSYQSVTIIIRVKINYCSF
jgi:hypothetical protein